MRNRLTVIFLKSTFGLEEDLLDFWILLIFPIIPILLWFRKEIRCLNIKGKNNDNDGVLVYQLIVELFIFIPTIITQGYIKALSGRLKHTLSFRFIK